MSYECKTLKNYIASIDGFVLTGCKLSRVIQVEGLHGTEINAHNNIITLNIFLRLELAAKRKCKFNL